MSPPRDRDEPVFGPESGPSKDSAAESGGERSTELNKALVQATRRITASRSVDEAMEAITEEARALIGAHQAVTSRTSDEGGWAQAITTVSLSDRYAAWRDYDAPPDGSGIYALVCQTNQPMRMTQAELEAHPAWKGFGAEAKRHPPMCGWLAVPLVGRDGDNIGLVQLSDKYDGGHFTERDEHLLGQLAHVAAVAVENAQLYETAQQARAESEAERRQLAEVFHSAPSSMCMLSGPDHVIERANEHYLALVGHRDVLGKPVREGLPEVVDQGFIELLDSVYHTGEPYIGRDVAIRLNRPDLDGPADRSLDVVYQPIRDAAETITGIYVQAVDLTERKRIEDALRTSEQRLKELNESLEERVTARTSQLRALTAELNQAEQRERRRLSDLLHDDLQQLLVAGKIQLSAAIEAMAHAPEALERAHKLIEQSIDKTRSLTSELATPVLYDAGLVPALKSLSRWMSEQQGLQVEVLAPETAEPAEENLRVLLFQTIRELLFNVVKHAQADRAEVTLRRTADDEIQTTVVDHGQGFDPASAESATSNEDGFGLFGMRERIAWVGGSATIDSAPGQGTRVVLSVPDEPVQTAAASAPADQPLQRKPSPGVAATGPAERAAPEQNDAIKVIVADDHAIVRQGLISALAGETDINIIGEAADGREAVDLAQRVRPDVVLLDVSMPNLDGLEAARAITAESQDIRVIGLSVHGESDMADSMLNAGAAAYVNKAEAPSRLLSVIRGDAG